MDSVNEEEEEFGSDFSSRSLGSGRRYVRGPPFIEREYMISPSDTDTASAGEEAPPLGRKLVPSDLKLDPSVFDPKKALGKLRNLVKDEHGQKLIKRQTNLVKAVVKGMSEGILMEDMGAVIEIMEYFAYNHQKVPEYTDLLLMILQIVEYPPKVLKSSDILKWKSDLVNYFTLLGELLVIYDDYCIQIRFLEIIVSLLTRPVPTEVNCVKLSDCLTAMEESLLPFTIASILETVSSKLFPRYIEIALLLVQISKKAAANLVQHGAIEFLLWRLDPRHLIRQKHIPPPFTMNLNQAEREVEEISTNYALLDSSLSLLWKLLWIKNDFNVQCEAPTCGALWSLRIVFHAETKKLGAKAVSARNNIAGIIAKLVSTFEKDLPIIQSGLALDIALLAVATEIGTKNSWAEKVTFKGSADDYALKKLMLICCFTLADNEYSAEIFKQQKVVEGVLDLINPALTPLAVSWFPSQFFRLLLIALPLLTTLASILPDVYVANKGNTRILMTLEWFMDDYLDQNPLLEALSSLCGIITCENNEAIVQDFKDQFGVKIILNICFYILERKSLRGEDQDKLSRIFLILETACKNEVKIQSYLGNMYIAVSIKFLRRLVNDTGLDSKIDPVLMISFMGFLWEAVVWCPTLLNMFIEQNGIFILLDLLETNSYPVQVLLLGMLVDMMDEGQSLTHVLTWRGKNGYGVLNLLIEIWIKEEYIFKVPRTQDGCIADLERPLMTDEQWYLTYCKNVPAFENFCPAIAEMVASARPKIHSVYKILKERYIDLTDLNNSLYCMDFDKVDPENQVYIPIIEHYLNLKFGEVWSELEVTMERAGINTTSYDGTTMTTMFEFKNSLALHIKRLQGEILTVQRLRSRNLEGNLYKAIRSCAMTSALDALHELDYLARTSLKKFQVEKKKKQMKEIEESISHICENVKQNLHNTVVRNTSVSYLCGKSVWLKSEKEGLLESNIIEPLSSDSSECLKFPEDDL